MTTTHRLRRASRALVLTLAILRIATLVASAAPAVTAVEINVADLERSVAFFTEVLGFEPIATREVYGEAHERLRGVFGMRARSVSLLLGEETVVLTEYLTPRGRPVPDDSRSDDRWFQHVAIVVSDIDAAYARLREHRVRHVSTGPQTLPAWNPNAGGIRAFYFQDDDGHNLEIIWYPPGKGDPRWQRRDGRLFLGIDHTAIVVGNTEASLAFWRDTLGLRVVGASENHGPEQEHLNLVFGARLRITALRGESGPGVEFLEYLAPRGGRVAPADLASNDLASWTTVLAGLDPDVVLGSTAARRVSSGAVDLDRSESGFSRGAIVRDPDGHAVAVIVP